MTIRFFVNFALLAIPIAATLGILFGIQTHRQATGQTPLFAPKPLHGITKTRYCQKAFGIHPKSKGQEYTLNPNQWGWNEGDPGKLCMNVTEFNNETYATNTMAPEFFVAWQYPPGPETAPVHAFPNIKVDTELFPATLKSLSQVDVDLEWTYGIGNETVTASSEAELKADDVNTNVAIDMFVDADKDKSKDSTKAKYEVMVWFAAFGPATQPIGLADKAVTTKVISGTTFSLYAGQNGLKQNVLTWYPDKPVYKFKGDLTPLIEEVLKVDGTKFPKANFPSGSDYMGYLSLGSEALYAKKTVTFHVPKLSIDIKTGTTNA